jgi:hypothetical protein
MVLLVATVLSIAAQHVTVEFDNVPSPCKIYKVRSRFTVMKNFYVYCKQFPLILANIDTKVGLVNGVIGSYSAVNCSPACDCGV